MSGGPYTLTSGTAPRWVVDKADCLSLPLEGPAWWFPEDLLPSIADVTIHGPIS